MNPIAEGLEEKLIGLIHDQITEVLFVSRSAFKNLNIEAGIGFDVLDESSGSGDGDIHFLVVAEQILLHIALVHPIVVFIVVERLVLASSRQNADLETRPLHILIESGLHLQRQVTRRNHHQRPDARHHAMHE